MDRRVKPDDYGRTQSAIHHRPALAVDSPFTAR
jgi:hypothetical protein